MLRLLSCPTTAQTYDVIIIGSGLTGCVAASRLLRKKPTTKIAIIEEGTSPVNGLTSAPFFAPYLPLFPWTKRMCSTYSRNHGSVIGGSCAIAEGPFIVKGLKEEYDSVADTFGCPKFKLYEHYFETILSYAEGASKSKGGTLPVSFPTLRQLNSDINARFQQSCIAGGLRPISSTSADCDGFGPTQALLINGRRCRPTDLISQYNIDLFAGTSAASLILKDRRVEGVSVMPSHSKKAGAVALSASEVVLCGGGIGSPALLLRSGLGPAEHLKGNCKIDIPELGQSVIEAPQISIPFRVGTRNISKSVNLANVQPLYRSYKSYVEDGSGPLASFAEWQAFVRGSDDRSAPNCRLTLSTAYTNGLPTISEEGFTVNIALTGTHERGKLLPIMGSSTETEVQYQYSYCGTEANLQSLDEGVLWSTMLCDCSSNVKYSIGDEHPFKNLQAAAAPPHLAAPETTKEYIKAMVTGSGDVYGACPLGSVTDSNTMRLKGVSNVIIGDVSVIPRPMAANKLALGIITACIAAETL